jgi:Zn-dependent M28 family amino/carboxypeptidase
MKSFLSKTLLVTFFVAVITTLSFAQLPKTDAAIKSSLKKHISFLAHDKLQGRLVGSKGEKLAYEYIITQFKKNKIEAKGTENYLQTFTTKKKLNNPHATENDTNTTSISGHNVIGFIDNHAANTIIIGAHYDHLGYDEYGGSTYRAEKNKKPQIHNGADDNASGTGALIELSELLSKSTFKKNNYLFIAFSGEEEGLLGSNYFCKHPTIDTATITYMINMDMLGRLDTAKHSFVISGTGTSPIWNTVLPTISMDGLTVKYDQSGTGSSDHTSFYNIGIPALHFFTGTHYDYHKPSDDEEKINYDGELSVIKYIYELVGKINEEPKLAFTRTKEDTTSRVSFKVTLGIMPDYLFDGKGVKVDGVTDGKPASKAGIKRGDVIVQMGELKTEDMTSYMKALSHFKKGESTKVKVLHDGKEEEKEVTF